MLKLKVKLLRPEATAPTVATPGEDLGYDLYSAEDITLYGNLAFKVSTGVALEFPHGFGGKIYDRSSMAVRGITTSAGLIDSGYRGEVNVLLTLHTLASGLDFYQIKRGDRIAQIVPTRVHTGEVEVVEELSTSARGAKGFGSSGK
jgi:dUTP pyrophosphatase